WSGDGRQLASGSDDKTVRLWEPDTGKLVRTLEGHENGVLAVAWSGDGRQLASGSDDQTVRLWEPDTGKPGKLIRTLEGHLGAVFSVCWLDGDRLASSSEDGSIRIWDAASGRCLATLYQFPNEGWLAIAADNRFTGNAQGKRRLTFADGWALYPAARLPHLEDAGAVRNALTPHG
ncbi:MAG: WD40 repeat domain-containing protein, partial [Acidobacteria bacterium]|nr:WD40 repeat domain-containing protein [Acidobacteriota bacterium]